VLQEGFTRSHKIKGNKTNSKACPGLMFRGFTEIALIEVKSGATGIGHLRSFMTVVNQQKASIGVFMFL